MTVTAVRARQKNQRRNKPTFHVDKLSDGSDLLALVRDWVTDLDRDVLREDATERYTSVASVDERGRTLLISTEAGHFGESGSTKNVNTHEETHKVPPHESTTIATRMFLMVPEGAEVALWFIERAGTIAGGARLLKLFELDWISRFPTVTLDTDLLVEGEAWLEDAKLEQVDAYIYNWQSDPDDGAPHYVGTLKQTLRPDNSTRFFPEAIYRAFLEGKISKGRLMGFSEGQDPDLVKVRLGDGQRSKTFVLGTDRTPTLQYLLTSPGEALASDEVFRRFCLDVAQDSIYPSLHIDWQTRWNTATA